MKATDINYAFLVDEDEADMTKSDMPASEGTPDPAISRLDAADSSMVSETFKVEGTFARASLSRCFPNPRSIYQNLISAITLSLLYALTFSGRYTPLSNRSFIAFNGFNSYDQKDDDWVSTDVENCSEFLLHVQWLSNGTLVIFSSHHESFRWRSLFSDLSQPVTISPFGIPALPQSFTNEPRYSSSIASHDVRSVHRDKISRDHPELAYHKEVVRDFLRVRGITVPEQTDWVWHSVRLYEEAEEENTRPEDTMKLLWPAQLSIRQAATKPNYSEDSFYLWGGAKLATIDPLAEAEQWFISRESREKAEQEYQRLQEEKLKSRHDQSSSDDDSIPGINPIIDPQQDIQGIYPTPPDGFNSQTVAPSADSAMTTTVQSPHDPVMVVRNIEDNSLLIKDETHVPMPESELQLGEYDNDDLFDDFSANGLTEADFNFFDKPDDDNAPNAPAVDGAQGTYLAAPHTETRTRSFERSVMKTNHKALTQMSHDGRTSDVPHVETAGRFASQAIVMGLLADSHDK